MAIMENPDQERISAEIRSLIADIIECPEEEIQGDVSFVDLGADSLMALEIVASIEKKYRIHVPEEHLQRVKTFNDVVMLVREHLPA